MSPEFDRATADIAIGLLKDMHLGHGPATDLLAISFAGTDNVGHSFGTNGIEMCVQQAALDLIIGEVLAATRKQLLSYPQVAAVATAEELSRMPVPSPRADNWSLLERARASFDPSRSGDLLVMLKQRISPIARHIAGYAVGHGTPWDYDRRVPMLFWYPGAVAHEAAHPVATVDILPTLAPFIGLTVPADEIDGRCIDLDPGAIDTCKQ